MKYLNFHVCHTDIKYKTSTAWVLSPIPFSAWYGLNKVLISQVEGTVHRVWYWYNSPWLLSCITQHVLYQFYPDLPMHFLLSEYFLWRMCALSITMFKQCTKNFFDQLILLCRNLWYCKTDLSNQHLTCTYCTKRLVEI